MAEAATLWISEHLAEKIRAHGAETYPHECCGALLGRDSSAVLESDRGSAVQTPAREILRLFPLVNRRDDSPRNRFSVTAEDVLAAEKAARCAAVASTSCNTTTLIQTYALAQYYGLSLGGTNPFTYSATGCGNTVTASYTYSLAIPFVGTYSLPLSATACSP